MVLGDDAGLRAGLSSRLTTWLGSRLNTGLSCRYNAGLGGGGSARMRARHNHRTRMVLFVAGGSITDSGGRSHPGSVEFRDISCHLL